MQRRFESELQNLKTSLIKMGSIVELAIEHTIEAMIKQNGTLADQVIRDDAQVNALELDNERAIIDLLALQQPVASDLRFILAASKINNDLERIGDHAVNLAESSLALMTMATPLPALNEIQQMTQVTKRMLSDAIDSFIHVDPAMGEAVLKMDDTADSLNKKIAQEMMIVMKSNPTSIEQALEMIRVSRNLERVADLATNIAEEVVFIANARIVKHHADDMAR
ncbi:MAG: phosphate signaling complex protein PhoU [Ignavibacteriales bacterium]|nr:phosphate signaling complex protein PhoU [Ignavibacteriales bacterium]